MGVMASPAFMVTFGSAPHFLSDQVNHAESSPTAALSSAGTVAVRTSPVHAGVSSPVEGCGSAVVSLTASPPSTLTLYASPLLANHTPPSLAAP